MQDEREKKPGSDEHIPDEPGAKPGREPPHPAGPHARPDLTNEDATPGAGSLPGERGGSDADPGSG